VTDYNLLISVNSTKLRSENTAGTSVSRRISQSRRSQRLNFIPVHTRWMVNWLTLS